MIRWCIRSIPLWHCIPTCFQVPIVKQLEVAPSLSFPSTSISRNEGNTKQQQVQLRPKKQYISGDSYKKHYSSPDDFHQFNNLNLAQKQQYEENESWQPYHHSDEPIIYVAETTPNPYDELIDPALLTSRQNQPISMLNRYDDYLLEALNDISNLTTSMHPAPISAIEHSFENISVAKQKSVPSQVMTSDNSYPTYPLKIEKLTNPDQIADPKGKLKWTSFNVLKRQKTYSTKNAASSEYLLTT
ncbi:unnamed protein product [Acanthocheilonema viteae]|uniref:Uncharacterized protein n=1 Tax=Acanthocheilonema viteae TaxID=6277 RepID=A0A498SAV4_ACAVI|nr:unnamed protein product [Acanthocheilonema viteae]